MREVKFRGWSPEYDKWIYGGFFRFPDGDCRIVDKYNPGGDKVGVVLIPVAEDSVGQCTGLKDAEGTEIYEGDVVRHVDEEQLMEVKWSNLHANFMMSKIPDYSPVSEILDGLAAANVVVEDNVFKMNDWKITD